jgi:hypothetical protein
MARVVTLAFKTPSPAEAHPAGSIVETLRGVYWRVSVRSMVDDEVWLQLWPLTGHEATLEESRSIRELPWGMAREVLDARMGPRATLAEEGAA